MDIQQWSENLTKEVYETWKTKYVFWKPAIKVFYGPVIQDPELMIISYQPGGKQADFEKESKEAFEKGEFSTTLNTYIDMNFAMSKRVRDFFDFDTDFTLLRGSVIAPLIFFRAPSIDVWQKELSTNKRAEMEDYSFGKVKEIIVTVNPQKILIIGIKTYRKLKELLPEIENEETIYTRHGSASPMAITADYKDKKIFAAMHFSGAQINKTDWKGMKELFKSWISES